MITQLASLRFEINVRGLVEMEKKSAMEKRGIKSPDRAEALMLTFADRRSGISRYYEELSEARAAREKDPNLPEPEPDTTLQDEYDRVTRILQSGGDLNDDEPLPAVEKVYSNICQYCKHPINGTATRIGAKAWHPECFGK
jgi:hypothetical protein